MALSRVVEGLCKKYGFGWERAETYYLDSIEYSMTIQHVPNDVKKQCLEKAISIAFLYKSPAAALRAMDNILAEALENKNSQLASVLQERDYYFLAYTFNKIYDSMKMYTNATRYIEGLKDISELETALRRALVGESRASQYNRNPKNNKNKK